MEIMNLDPTQNVLLDNKIYEKLSETKKEDHSMSYIRLVWRECQLLDESF